MKKFVGVLLLSGILLVGVLGYLGLVPGLSSIMVKQKDLGVVADLALVDAINSSIGHEVLVTEESLPHQGKIVYEGQIPLSGSYSSQEVTSVLASWSRNWAVTPFYNVQVKIHDDGTAEASGIVQVEKIINLAKELGYNDAQIDEAAKLATFINGDLPVYVSGTVSVTNNQLSLNTTNMQIGNLTVPEDIKEQVTYAVADAVQRRMAEVPELQIESLRLDAGKLAIEGEVPAIERPE